MLRLNTLLLRFLSATVILVIFFSVAANGRAISRRRQRREDTSSLNHSRLLQLYCEKRPEHERCNGVRTNANANANANSRGRNGNARVDRAEFIKSACARDPTLSFCSGSSNSAERTVVETSGRQDNDLCSVDLSDASDRCRAPKTQGDADFCKDYAIECDVNLPKPDGGYCSTYDNEYSNKCTGAVTRVDDQRFCTAYKVNCEDRPKANGDQPGVCQIYEVDYKDNCQRDKQLDDDWAYFCDRYHYTCVEPPPEQQRGSGDGGTAASGERRLQVVDGDGKATPPPAGSALQPGSQGPASKLNATQAAQRQQCKQYEQHARVHCFGRDIAPNMIAPCHGYIRDCFDYYGDDEPLAKAASLFNSKVGWSTNNWGFSGIPAYPFNPTGTIGGGDQAGVDFGSWGGGYRESSGVADFWQQGNEAGGNWYTGKYGAKDTWGVPIVPFVNGDSAVQTGERVGNFWNRKEGPVIDWFNGGVQNNKGWQVPIAGVGFNQGSNVNFPSIADFAPLIAAGR